MNLIEEVIVKYFLNDIIDLSRDKVVNVRIRLSMAFLNLYKSYEDLTL